MPCLEEGKFAMLRVKTRVRGGEGRAELASFIAAAIAHL